MGGRGGTRTRWAGRYGGLSSRQAAMTGLGQRGSTRHMMARRPARAEGPLVRYGHGLTCRCRTQPPHTSRLVQAPTPRRPQVWQAEDSRLARRLTMAGVFAAATAATFCGPQQRRRSDVLVRRAPGQNEGPRAGTKGPGPERSGIVAVISRRPAGQGRSHPTPPSPSPSTRPASSCPSDSEGFRAPPSRRASTRNSIRAGPGSALSSRPGGSMRAGPCARNGCFRLRWRRALGPPAGLASGSGQAPRPGPGFRFGRASALGHCLGHGFDSARPLPLLCSLPDPALLAPFLLGF
jgi:hypothetical protein